MRTLSVMMWVFGVLRETFRTITLFITTTVVTDITNIRYLRSKVSELHLNSPRLLLSGLPQRENLLANQWHCLRRLWDLLGDQEEENSLAQKSGDRHGALLAASCRRQRRFHFNNELFSFFLLVAVIQLVACCRQDTSLVNDIQQDVHMLKSRL